jgi:hypothetical protein
MFTSKAHDAIEDFLQTDGIRVPHGAASIAGKAITGETDRVDIRRAQCITFLKDARAFIDHHEETPIEDFFTRDSSLGNAGFSRGLPYQRFDFGIGIGFRFSSPGTAPRSGEPSHFMSCRS